MVGGFLPIIESLPTHVEAELSCDNTCLEEDDAKMREPQSKEEFKSSVLDTNKKKEESSRMD